MKKSFKSCLAKQMEEFVYAKKASGRWCGTHEDNLHFFDNYCHLHFPDDNVMTPKMLDWCRERPTENGNSCRSRISVIVNFIKYAQKKGWTSIELPTIAANRPCTYIPHAFTHVELASFFQACDNHVTRIYIRGKSINNKLNLLELPVYFRLLLSTGMRTCEARWLKRSDVNLEEGVIHINKSKGIDQHRIALDDSMLDLLRLYDEHMAKIMPNRINFFPNPKDCHHRPAWAEYHFRKIWKSVSDAVARPYDLRSYYAVTNITKWANIGFELHENLIYLSRTMGHRNLQSTYGYFNITPVLADKIKALTESSFNELLPKISNHEK
jgi:integrase